jgi:hypothetical protein
MKSIKEEVLEQSREESIYPDEERVIDLTLAKVIEEIEEVQERYPILQDTLMMKQLLSKIKGGGENVK